ncbi:hypothetical protein F5B19DRAFT_124187 [Rostrohypoxylon terebratum]|nr:hypothetical protein F5B19DRAFT_124187 [Rostrohypoxylon terebratum]
MFVLFYILVNFCLVTAQDNRPLDKNNHFIYPKPAGPQYSNDPTVFESNENFTVGQAQSQPFKWVTNMTNMQIILCQEGNPMSVRRHGLTDCIDSSGGGWLYWDGDIGDIDLNNGSQAYLGVWNCSEPGSTPVFFSHYMNLINSSATASTSTVSTSSTLPAATAPITSPTSATEPAPTQAGTSSSNGSSNGAAIGGGIGGGIGGALIIIAAAFAFWKYRGGREKKQPVAVQQIADWSNRPDYSSMSQGQGYGVLKPPYQPSELSSLSPMAPELPLSDVAPTGTTDSRRVYEMS